jgi:hypothetical protein
MIRLVQQSRDATEVDDTVKSLKDDLRNLSDELMKEEMVLVEQFEVSATLNVQTITDVVLYRISSKSLRGTLTT